MSEAIKALCEKISSYQLFNFFYPGAIFVGSLKLIGLQWVENLSIGYFILLCYFIGMTSSRIGSLIIEDSLIKTGFITKHDYDKQIKAESKDSKVMLLLEICNTYRTISAVFLLLTILCIVNFIKPLNISHPCACWGIVSFLLCILFGVAFCKQYKYVEKRINSITNHRERT